MASPRAPNLRIPRPLLPRRLLPDPRQHLQMGELDRSARTDRVAARRAGAQALSSSAQLQRSFYAAFRDVPSYPLPPPPPDLDTDRSYRWRGNLPTNLHSSDPPPPSPMAADADELYDRMRRNMGLDP